MLNKKARKPKMKGGERQRNKETKKEGGEKAKKQKEKVGDI